MHKVIKYGDIKSMEEVRAHYKIKFNSNEL